MVIIKQFSEFANIASSTVNEVLETATENAIDGVCNIRAKYPSRFRRGGILTPVLDRLCSENGHDIPPSPSVPYTGGQCDTLYHAFGRYNSMDGGSCPRNAKWRTSVAGNGTEVADWTPREDVGSFAQVHKIDGTRINVRPISQSLYDSNNVGDTPTLTMRLRALGEPCNLNTGINYGNSFIVEKLVRVDGQPDDCGNLPGSYPDDPAIDSADFSRTIQICGTPGDADDQRCVDVTIDFDPDLDENGNQCYSIDGERYCLTPDGIEKQDEPTECAKEPPPIDELAPTTEEESTDSEEEDPAIAYVTTEITTFPFSGKTILQPDSNDNDYFAGYFNWTTSRPDGSYRHSAIPIRKRLQIFTRPASATGYKAYTVNGAKLRITVYKEQEENNNGT